MSRLIGRPTSALLAFLMVIGSLLLWVGAPLGWLWVGSQVEAAGSLGTGLMVTMVGFLATVLAIVPMLTWLNRRHAEVRHASRRPIGNYSMLEVILVITAGVAVVGFSLWFFGFSGSSPIPIQVSF
jgi:uncharacterized membrane protein YbhN (UPF0104 family)